VNHTQNMLSPNIFQTPNLYIDWLMPLLLDAESRALMLIARCIHAPDISPNRNTHFTLDGCAAALELRHSGILSALAGLERFGVLRRVGVSERGAPFRVHLPNELEIDWHGLEARCPSGER